MNKNGQTSTVKMTNKTGAPLNHFENQGLSSALFAFYGGLFNSMIPFNQLNNNLISYNAENENKTAKLKSVQIEDEEDDTESVNMNYNNDYLKKYIFFI